MGEREKSENEEETQVLIVKNQRSEACRAEEKEPIGSSRKLALHLFTSCLVIAHLAANVNYLAFKAFVYAKEIRALLCAPWLLLLFLCEIAYFIGHVMAALDNVLAPSFRPDLTLPEDDKTLHYPTVHIFLPCCNEPTDVPQESILAALWMNYPQDRFKVFVLDDGADDDLRAFCETLQLESVESGGQRLVYLRRKKMDGVPHHFKCGNLNYGLQNSDAEFVVMMDADMILHPSFLRKLLPHIINSPDVAFVQIPQAYYNLPPGDPLNGSSIFGYDRVLVHRDSLDSATCIGTGAIFRRSVLDEIGGFQPQSITEDTTTAFALFNRGYKSVYLSEKLQIGLTPWTLEGYIKQRQRWGKGAFQQFATTWKSMLGAGSKLNFILRVSYVWHTGYYYLAIVNVVLAMIMLSVLAFRLSMTVGSTEENHNLILYLALQLVLWRLAWYFLWLEVPLSIQSRNRDESQFWWMTPFFFKMVLQATFAYKNTFTFVPTSNIDRHVSASGNLDQSEALKRLSQLKHVRVHLIFVFLAVAVVGGRSYVSVLRYEVGDCREMVLLIGISFYLLTTCAQMLLPVMYILWPTTVKPEQRKSLLTYNSNGIPQCSPKDCQPKWHWSVLFYELISLATLVFWVVVLFLGVSNSYSSWCTSS